MESKISLSHHTCPLLSLSGARSIQSMPPEDPSKYYHRIYVWVFKLVCFTYVSPPKTCIHFFSPLHATCPAYLILLYLITQIILGEVYRSLSSSLCSFLNCLVTSSFLGQIFSSNPILKRPQPTCLPQCERPSSTPTQINKQNYISEYLYL
jgi:hypothetical protein